MFFSQIGVPSVRAIVLADVSIKVKITFQTKHVLCGSDRVHCCGFPICVSGCLKVSVEKIFGNRCIFEVILKKS